MARVIFLGSVILCMIFLGLSQMSDPGVFGIHEEPERIMFYGGSGLLVGLFGLIALGSGIYLGATRFAGVSEGQRRFMLAIMLIVLIAVLTTFVIRFYPV
ncbi:MAG: hypothetical protein V3U34_04430 [candidate division NC10 bacterium]|jgi:hypothetical protein